MYNGDTGKLHITLLRSTNFLLNAKLSYDAASAELHQCVIYLLFTLEFRYEVTKHRSESHCAGAFDDCLLHLNQT